MKTLRMRLFAAKVAATQQRPVVHEAVVISSDEETDHKAPKVKIIPWSLIHC